MWCLARKALKRNFPVGICRRRSSVRFESQLFCSSRVKMSSSLEVHAYWRHSTEVIGMVAHESILLPAAGLVIAAASGILIRARRKREGKLRREDFKNVCKLEDELKHRTTAKD
jgi:hypothetical protein